MKLAVYRSINFPLLPVTRFSKINIQSTGAYRLNTHTKPAEIVLASKNCVYRYNCGTTTSQAAIKIGKIEMDRKDIFIYPAPVNDHSVETAGITDDKNNNPALLNAVGNILSSTTLFKASVELPSLATGVYFVRVKNKVPGEATNLRFVNI